MGNTSTLSRFARLCALGAVGVALSGCGSNLTPKVALTSGTESVVATSSDVVNLSNLPVFTQNAATSGEESFSVAAYGVAASAIFRPPISPPSSMAARRGMARPSTAARPPTAKSTT